jgi:hypothetical protein
LVAPVTHLVTPQYADFLCGGDYWRIAAPALPILLSCRLSSSAHTEVLNIMDVLIFVLFIQVYPC